MSNGRGNRGVVQEFRAPLPRSNAVGIKPAKTFDRHGLIRFNGKYIRFGGKLIHF